jgi:flagellar motor switch protein FliN/FliY
MADEEPAGGETAPESKALAGLPPALARLAAGLKVAVTVQVGGAQLPLSELADLAPGKVVALDRRMGDPVEVLVSGCAVARGELVSIEGRLGVRITEILAGGE